MFATIFILNQLLHPTLRPFTIDEMQDIQNHAESAVNLRLGKIEHPHLKLSEPSWTFKATVKPTIAPKQNPFESYENPFCDTSNPFEE
jgi:hypothetical protein